MVVATSPNGTLTVLDTTVTPPSVLATVDLSSDGTAPRASAVTNNGYSNDNDETILVAMFFGQLRSGKTALNEGQDDQREGHVIAIAAGAMTVFAGSPVLLSPVADTGFKSNGQLSPAPGQVPAVASTDPPTFTTSTGGYPNQLASMAIRPASAVAYVVGNGASPNGPLRSTSTPMRRGWSRCSTRPT